MGWREYFVICYLKFIEDNLFSLKIKQFLKLFFIFLSLPIYHSICKVPVWRVSFTVDVRDPKPNRPNTMNLVEKRA